MTKSATMIAGMAFYCLLHVPCCIHRAADALHPAIAADLTAISPRPYASW